MPYIYSTRSKEIILQMQSWEYSPSWTSLCYASDKGHQKPSKPDLDFPVLQI